MELRRGCLASSLGKMLLIFTVQLIVGSGRLQVCAGVRLPRPSGVFGLLVESGWKKTPPLFWGGGVWYGDGECVHPERSSSSSEGRGPRPGVRAQLSEDPAPPSLSPLPPQGGADGPASHTRPQNNYDMAFPPKPGGVHVMAEVHRSLWSAAIHRCPSITTDWIALSSCPGPLRPSRPSVGKHWPRGVFFPLPAWKGQSRKPSGGCVCVHTMAGGMMGENLGPWCTGIPPLRNKFL